MHECTRTGFYEAGRRTHLSTVDEEHGQKPVSPCKNDDIDGISEGSKDEQEEMYDDFDKTSKTNRGRKPKL